MLSPREHETATNKSPLIRAVSLILMVISIFSVLIRILTRLSTVRKPKLSSLYKLDDLIIFLAMILMIGQSTAVYSQGANGLGKLQDISAREPTILKAQSASDIFFILALSLAKISATTTIRNMTPLSHKRILPTEILVGCWALSSIIVRGFACSLPRTWDYINGQCINMVAFWIYVNVVNILTDLFIAGIIVKMLLALQMPPGTKAMVIGVFGCRVLTIPPVVCHIYYYQRAVNSVNPMFDMWKPSIIIQVIQCVSITTTCIPFFWRFLKSLDSGQLGAGDLFGAMSKSSNSKSGTTTRGTKSRAGATLASSASSRPEAYELTTKACPGNTKKLPNNVTDHVPGSLWDIARQNSQEALVDPTSRD